jgi:hypothetical protein
MRSRILLCVGLIAIGSTITLDSTKAIAKGLVRITQSAPKITIALEKSAKNYVESGLAKQESGNNQGAIADYNLKRFP